MYITCHTASSARRTGSLEALEGVASAGELPAGVVGVGVAAEADAE
jgi:hypothetical protein